MKKKLKAIIILAGLCGAALTLAACAFEEAPYHELAAESGGIVKVVYEQNGGKFVNLDDANLIDSYPLKNFESGKGVALVAPGDDLRDGGSTNKLNSTTSSVSRDNYTLIGWYRDRSEGTRVNSEGEPLDEDGVLCSMSGKPQGNVYSGLWNFSGGNISRLTLDMCELVSKEGETPVYEYHLWAAWQPSITYKFYRPSTEEDRRAAALEGRTLGEWIEYAEPLSANAENPYLALPYFDADGGECVRDDSFPDASASFGASALGYTLDAIYRNPDRSEFYAKDSDDGTDWLVPNKALLTERDGAYYIRHSGGVDYEHGYAYDTTVNLYTTWKEGRYFRVKEASQMTADANGYYFIENDLTFTDTDRWGFGGITFRGRMVAEDPVTIGGIVSVQSGNLYGGVFAALAEGATVRNVRFENVTLELSAGFAGFANETAYFGLFAGTISENSVVENVSVSGTMKIGGDNFITRVQSGIDESFSVGFVSGNGVRKGISNDEIEAVRVASTALDENYVEVSVYKLRLDPHKDQDTIGIYVLPRGDYDSVEPGDGEN